MTWLLLLPPLGACLGLLIWAVCRVGSAADVIDTDWEDAPRTAELARGRNLDISV